jgi:hypothetical protein
MPVPMPGFVRVDALFGIVVGLGYVIENKIWKIDSYHKCKSEDLNKKKQRKEKRQKAEGGGWWTGGTGRGDGRLEGSNGGLAAGRNRENGGPGRDIVCES